MPDLHEIYPSKLVSGLTTLYLNGLDQVDPQPGIETLEAMIAGSVDPQIIATAFAEPKVKVTARDLGTILAAISITNGFAVTTSATFQFQKRVNGGVYTSGSAHISLTATGGLLYAEEFGAKQDDKEGADISLTFCPTFDGTNLPLVVNTAVALAGTPSVAALFALGPVIFEGAQVTGVQSVRVKTGIEVQFKRADGELYSRIVVIVKRKPTIEIELLNQALAATLTLGGTYPITSGITAYLQKVVPGGGRVAYATAEHISVTAAAGAYKLESLSGSKADNAMLKLTVMPTGTLSMSAADDIVIP